MMRLQAVLRPRLRHGALRVQSIDSHQDGLVPRRRRKRIADAAVRESVHRTAAPRDRAVRTKVIDSLPVGQHDVAELPEQHVDIETPPARPAARSQSRCRPVRVRRC